ncbi:MAG: hypothetical protein QNJ31_08080 [Candidatus Caenarcaniphilales bacterium]|nr:hypothetical protein [Candidatus Caenarcaniphilales bacterium]
MNTIRHGLPKVYTGTPVISAAEQLIKSKGRYSIVREVANKAHTLRVKEKVNNSTAVTQSIIDLWEKEFALTSDKLPQGLQSSVSQAQRLKKSSAHNSTTASEKSSSVQPNLRIKTLAIDTQNAPENKQSIEYIQWILEAINEFNLYGTNNIDSANNQIPPIPERKRAVAKYETVSRLKLAAKLVQEGEHSEALKQINIFSQEMNKRNLKGISESYKRTRRALINGIRPHLEEVKEILTTRINKK